MRHWRYLLLWEDFEKREMLEVLDVNFLLRFICCYQYTGFHALGLMIRCLAFSVADKTSFSFKKQTMLYTTMLCVEYDILLHTDKAIFWVRMPSALPFLLPWQAGTKASGSFCQTRCSPKKATSCSSLELWILLLWIRKTIDYICLLSGLYTNFKRISTMSFSYLPCWYGKEECKEGHQSGRWTPLEKSNAVLHRMAAEDKQQSW